MKCIFNDTYLQIRKVYRLDKITRQNVTNVLIKQNSCLICDINDAW